MGAVAAFFLDPERGRSRRARTRDQAAGLIRSTGRRLVRATSYARASAAGAGARVARPRRTDVWFDDPTLAHKVETELFRDPTIPKASINVNAEHGTVVLRGAVDTQDEIERIMVGTMAIDGVRAVRSLLRLRADVRGAIDELKNERPEAVLTAR
jgi:hyperosmotically inducible periplasmic protein